MTREALELLRRHLWIVRPCACGRTIAARTEQDTDIFAAVALHNRTREHRAWRRREGIEP